MFPTLLLSLLLGQALPVEDSAPSRADEPYQLLVGLQFAEDPLFTRVFRTSVVRQARDQLTNYFGPLAKIQVQEEHPVLEKVGAAGLQGLTLSPAEFASYRLPDKVFLVSLAN